MVCRREIASFITFCKIDPRTSPGYALLFFMFYKVHWHDIQSQKKTLSKHAAMWCHWGSKRTLVNDTRQKVCKRFFFLLSLCWTGTRMVPGTKSSVRIPRSVCISLFVCYPLLLNSLHSSHRSIPSNIYLAFIHELHWQRTVVKELWRKRGMGHVTL